MLCTVGFVFQNDSALSLNIYFELLDFSKDVVASITQYVLIHGDKT